MPDINRQPENIPALELLAGDVVTAAEALLGRVLIKEENGRQLKARIVETEAYHEFNDPACHAARGRTKRNSVMFEKAGHIYVYFTYGMHYCMNLVAEDEGRAAAVLIRAVEPLNNIDLIKTRRPKAKKDADLTNGPAKLCRAFNITTKQNGFFLGRESISIVEAQKDFTRPEIVKTTRIGISKGRELPWRFYLKGNRFVSKP